MKIGGISRQNREILGVLNRAARGPFDLAFVAKTLNISKTKAKNLVIFWVSQGWLTRIKRGLYSTVSLSAIRPESQKEDPWVVAGAVFSPCYIGGWSACEHWGLTEQVFNDVVVYSTRRFNNRIQKIQGTNYLIKTVAKEKLYGLKAVWRGTSKLLVSDPSRTIIDILETPKLGGGIRNTAFVVGEYFDSTERDDKKLSEYLSKHKNGVVCKRLGFLIEHLRINAQKLMKYCTQSVTSGYSKLDPDLPSKGKYLRRWNLQLNADIMRPA